MARCDILVRGGGAVGMSAALALSRQGLGVVLVEPPQPTRGEDLRAYALNAASVALLDSLKVWGALPGDARCAVHEMRIEGDDGHSALEFSAWASAVGELAWIVDAAALQAALAEAVRFAPHIERVAMPPPDVPALTVVAEGRDSASRAGLGVRWHQHDYGQTAIAARLAGGRAHAGLARQWFRSPDVLALLPTHRPLHGQGLALVWSLPAERAQALLDLPEHAFEAELMTATGGAAGPLALASARAAWPLTVARAEPLCGAGWVLVGDAAHRVHPLAGQGLNLGLADVASLAAVIEAREPWRALGDERLLSRHVRERAPATFAMRGLTDALLELFAHSSPWAGALRNRGLALVDRLPPLKRALARAALGR